VTSTKKALHVILGAIFSNQSILGDIFAQIFREFVKVFRAFSRIFTKSKLLGVRLHPLQHRLLHQCAHMSRISHEILVRQVLLTLVTGKWPRGLPTTRFSDYISNLAWSRVGVEPGELFEIVVDREREGFCIIFGINYCPGDRDPRDQAGMEKNE